MNLERRSWVSKIVPIKEINRKRLEVLLTKEFNYDSIIDRINEILINSISDPIYIRIVDIRKILKENGYDNSDTFPVHIIMQQLVFDLNDAGYKAAIDVTRSYDIDHDMDMVYSTLIIEFKGGKS